MMCFQALQVETVKVDGRPLQVHPYRCTRCGGCYCCEHRASLPHLKWLCRDGTWRPVIFDIGVPVSAPVRVL